MNFLYCAPHTKCGFLNFSYEISTVVNLNCAGNYNGMAQFDLFKIPRTQSRVEFDLLTMLTAPKYSNGLIFFYENALSKRRHPLLNS